MIRIQNFTHRLGNQLFQLAAAIGVSTRDCDEILFPDWKYKDFFEGDFTIKTYYEHDLSFHWKETGFHYTKIPTPTTSIDGYFQSEKYFAHCPELIRSQFAIKQPIIDKVKDKYSTLLNKETVAVHVRRGDYALWPNHHPIIGKEYFPTVIDKHFPNCEVIFVSDDLNWCQENFPQYNMASGNSDIEDLALMTLTDHVVISNSTFSWWGAWLNNNEGKKIVAPKHWFGSAYSHFNTDDLYCKDWIKE